MTVADIFGPAREKPDAVAFICDEELFTYGWLSGAVASQTSAFADRGLIGPGITVVAVRRWPDTMVAILALRLLGRTVLPLSEVPLIPMLALDGLRDVVTSAQETWPGLDAACRAKDLPLHPYMPRHGEGGGVPTATAEEGGQIVQTSGTTGSPKFVLYESSFEDAFLRQWSEDLDLEPRCVLAIPTFPPWTAVGHRGPLACWRLGGTLVMQQARSLTDVFRRPDLTHAVLNPSMLREVLDAADGMIPLNPNLRLGIVGATAARDQIAAAKMRLASSVTARIGTTETRNVAMTRQDEAEDYVWHRPSPHAAVSCADDAGRSVPSGTIGRLRIATSGGPQAYLGDAATSASFFRDGFFYTGDLAIFRDDGRFALQGRTTDILNVDGHKKAPAPVEERLRDAFSLRGVCLVSMRGEAGDEEIVIVIESDGPVDTTRLGEALRQELGSFPRARVFYTQRLPRNAMGKLMRDEVKAMVPGQRPVLSSPS